MHERIEFAEEQQCPIKKISLVEFHPATIDQDMVVQFIKENPEYESCFDMTWLVLDKDMMYELHSYDRDLFSNMLGELQATEAKWERFESIKDEYWSKLHDARIQEEKKELSSLVIPGHPNKFPKFLWEEETREMRKKDKEFADLLASTGNKDAHKWYQARKEKQEKAKSTLDSLVEQMDELIQKE